MQLNKEAKVEFHQSESNILAKVLMFGSIISLNISLMLFVSFYWINPQFHSLITGKPF